VLVSVGWVLFRAVSLGEAGVILSRMAWPTEGAQLGRASAAVVLLCLAVTLAGHLLGSRVDMLRFERRVPSPVMGAALACLLALGLFLLPEGGRAFIYFQF
jgi:hypothetical protein